ncbi:MAG TPA: YheC/YheD family protein [Syntrophomonadaceae bacterium]|nr:YheC/YheD family protein [Syntrophomonadaceae bacterium]HPR93519.1 YheC/YheD family protein [Syntrophomonadaceae bacterium]
MSNYTMFTASVNSRLSDSAVMITRDLAETLGLQDSDQLYFYAGQVKKKLKLSIRNSDKLNMRLDANAGILKKLYLQPERSYGIKKDINGLHLGPVVGISADIYNEPGRPFGNQSFFFQQLLKAGEALGEICFAFNPRTINWNNGNVTGYTYNKKGWSKRTFPLPDVIYPRERAYAANNNFRRRLEKAGTRFFNPPLVGKWETHLIMKKNPDLAKYLPETRLIKNFNQVEDMVKKYQAVYLKPVSGSQGKNIIRVLKKKNTAGYEYQYEINNLIIKGSAPSINRLQSALKRVMGNRSYIVQKQINLLKLDDNIVDVRILVQKNDLGKWETTGIACREGKRGSITSNISAGGSGKKLDTVLHRHFDDDSRRRIIIEEICFLAIESAKTLEKAIGPAGEIGVDIGIDKDGEVWFIETNLRPARHVFLLIGEQETRLKSVEMPMLYLRYLAGFVSKER